MSPDLRRVTVASLNLHAGVDRGGVPFDVGAALRSLDADVVVLQEVWRPDEGPSSVDELGGALGYDVRFSPVGSGWLRVPGDRRGRGALGASAVCMEWEADGRGMRPGTRGPTCSPGRPAARGRIGVAVLSRLPVADTAVFALDQLPRDRARRSVLLLTVDVDGGPLVVAGTHMAHLSQGSLRHFAQLRDRLQHVAAGRPSPGALVGDMNLWGPVAERVLPGWHRAVVGRSWPAGRPVAQPDHILVGTGVTVAGGRVLPPVGSDHRPVRAELQLPPC